MKRYISITFIVVLSVFVFADAQISDPDPIVIVPGIGASWKPEIILNPSPTASLDGWRFSPGIKQYDLLVQSFKDEGLVEGEDFFVAFYDWRQSNSDSANDYLVPIIDEALAHSSTGKVDIVAHSMGGLVSRSYIQGDVYRDDVDQFIMLGTPNHGSSDVYTLWEAGEIPNNWEASQQETIAVLLWWIEFVSVFTADSYDTIHNYVPSIQELLPTYDYLTDKETGDTILANDMKEKNLFLSVLNLQNNKQTLVDNVPGGINIIAGNGENTVNDIPVVPHAPEDGKFWADGKPDPITPVRNDADGDNRVLLSSAFLGLVGPPPVVSFNQEIKQNFFAKLFAPLVYAQFGPPNGPGGPPPFPGPSPIEEQTISSKHGDLPTVSIPEIFSILGLDAPTIAYAPIPEPDTVLTFWFASPVDVKITDPFGNTTSKTISNISGAVYDSSDDPLGFKMVLVENPEIGEYVIELLGLAAGEYHVGVGSFSDFGDATETVKSDIKEGDNITYIVQYDPSKIEAPIIITKKEVAVTPQDLFEKFRQIVKASEMNKNVKKRLIREANIAERTYKKGNIRRAKHALFSAEMVINILKGWLIPTKDAHELLDLIVEIRKLL
jgi:pimeloyl-ACP methyl ester carboxylesterase